MPAGLVSTRLLIYVKKKKAFCRSIIRELQLFEVGVCLCLEPADLGMLLESEGGKILKHKKKEKNPTLCLILYLCGP